jgi:hypothetical protein
MDRPGATIYATGFDEHKRILLNAGIVENEDDLEDAFILKLTLP